MPRKKQRTLSQDLADLRRLKRNYEAKDQAKKEAGERLQQKMSEVYHRMELEDVQSQKTGGNNFVRASTVYGKINDKEAFLEWARGQDETLIEETPRKGLLNELARAALDNGAAFPPGVTANEKEYIAIRAAK